MSSLLALPNTDFSYVASHSAREITLLYFI